MSVSFEDYHSQSESRKVQILRWRLEYKPIIKVLIKLFVGQIYNSNAKAKELQMLIIHLPRLTRENTKLAIDLETLDGT